MHQERTVYTGNGRNDHSHVALPVGVYKAKDLADEFGIASQTLSTRWYPWLLKVAEASLLKPNGRYTDLARDLFLDFKEQVKDQGIDAWVWVRATKENLVEAVAAAPLEPEIVPNDAETALATVGQTTDLLDEIIFHFQESNQAAQMTAIEISEGSAFQETESLEQLLQAEALYGAKIGTLRYRARKTAENLTMQDLKRRDLDALKSEATADL